MKSKEGGAEWGREVDRRPLPGGPESDTQGSFRETPLPKAATSFIFLGGGVMRAGCVGVSKVVTDGNGAAALS